MIDIYLDTANIDEIREGKRNPLVRGFTTNPSLLRKAGVTDYEAFAKDALQIVEGLPISFEIFSDEWDDIERQARLIASWGGNVNVKIPITNTKGESSAKLVRRLSDSGILCNVTAIFTPEQIRSIVDYVNPMQGIILSVFAGRIADTSFPPNAVIRETMYPRTPTIKFLWASTREVLNITEAEAYKYDIVTVSPDLLKKYEALKGKDLTEYSLETVQQFYNDAKGAGYTL